MGELLRAIMTKSSIATRLKIYSVEMPFTAVPILQRLPLLIEPDTYFLPMRIMPFLFDANGQQTALFATNTARVQIFRPKDGTNMFALPLAVQHLNRALSNVMDLPNYPLYEGSERVIIEFSNTVINMGFNLTLMGIEYRI